MIIGLLSGVLFEKEDADAFELAEYGTRIVPQEKFHRWRCSEFLLGMVRIDVASVGFGVRNT